MSVPGRIQLCEAIWKGDLEGVKKWLSPASMETTNWRGWTALVFACQAGNVEIVKYMLSQGANVHVKDKQGRTLLHHVRKSVELVELLLDCGLDVNQKDGLGNTPLHSVDPDERHVVRKLLESGADIICMNKSKVTPLSKFRHHNISSLFLEYLSICGTCNPRNYSDFECNFFKANHKRAYLRHLLKLLYAHQYDYLGKPGECPTNLVRGVVRDYLPDYVLKCQNFLDFAEECKAEYRKLKTEVIGGSSVTYFSVWNGSHSSLRNPLVQQAMTPDNCIQAFPIYGETLRKRYVDGARRLALLDEALETFPAHVQPLVPECVARVLDYLSFEDLKNLCIACKGPGNQESL